MKVIISGGGTGGHIFPAIAIADAIKAQRPRAELLFVGAEGRMEMERVPKAGYPIRGLWISGLQRKLTLDNLSFPLKVVSSLWRSQRILSEFRPDVAVGTGGYASGPLLEVASRRGIPTLIQEQNAYAGVTNKLLAGRVDRICVAYPDLEKYFPADKLLLTGNPVRQDIVSLASQPTDAGAARTHYGLSATRPTVLLLGGSLGARTLNEAMHHSTAALAARPDVQWIWQCGQGYYEQYRHSATAQLEQVTLLPFLDRMDLAYQAADVAICRAGALTIAELCILGMPALLVPSPNVAEDHQTKNARALADRRAALLLPDQHAKEQLVAHTLLLIDDGAQRRSLSDNARKLSYPRAADDIAHEVIRLGEKNGQ